MKQPLVSIGVPTYNRPAGLSRALESLVKQTYLNLEIIVSDNCSTNPEVAKVLAKFKSDSRIKIFVQPVNKGIFFNFNFVLEKANGDYFMRLADDDWIDENYIESCLEYLEINSDYSGAYGVAKIYDLENKFIKYDAEINLEQEGYEDRIRTYLSMVMYNSCFYGIMRKSYFPYLRVEKLIGDDWLNIARILFLGKYKMITNTNSYISTGGVSQNLDSLVNNLNFPAFTKHFPYFSIAINLAKDILWKSSAYSRLSMVKKLRLAAICYLGVYKRFNVGRELRKGIKIYFLKIFKRG